MHRNVKRLETVDGALVVDKPAGPTSHDIVQQVRRVVGTKVGHTGTLDPAATGVLVLVLGRATRLSALLTSPEKEYVGRLRLGCVTDTYDAQGRVLEELPVPEIERSALDVVLDRFRGTFEQVPPMFSAIKIGGEPLYRAARRREVRERPGRQVTIWQLDLLALDPPFCSLRVVCSAGTYIRSLAHDIGQGLGCGAVLEELRRTRSGSFRIEQALSPERLADEWQDRLLPMSQLLPDLPEHPLSLEEACAVAHGNPIPPPASKEGSAGAMWKLTFRGDLVALAEFREASLCPKIVLRPDLSG